MIQSRADALTVHLVVGSFVILYEVICSLFLICSLRFSKSFSRFGENLMNIEISPAVSITSESISEDLLTSFILKFKGWQGQ